MTSVPNLSNGVWNEIPLGNYFYTKLNPTFDQGPFNAVIKRRALEPEMPGEKHPAPLYPCFLTLDNQLTCLFHLDFFYLWVPILYLLRNIKWINTGKVLGRLLGTVIYSNMYLLIGYCIHSASGFMISPLIVSKLWNKLQYPVTQSS